MNWLEWLRDTGHTFFGPLVAVGEVVIGICSILGLFTGIMAFLGAILNFSFVFAGTAGVNPAMIVVSMFLILAWRNAGWRAGSTGSSSPLGTPGTGASCSRETPPNGARRGSARALRLFTQPDPGHRPGSFAAAVYAAAMAGIHDRYERLLDAGLALAADLELPVILQRIVSWPPSSPAPATGRWASSAGTAPSPSSSPPASATRSGRRSATSRSAAASSAC